MPDGCALDDGGVLSWSSSRNLTVAVTIPNINYTDNTIYVIVSAMTMSGTVLQVAAGIEPGQNHWSTYVMYVTSVYGSRKDYQLVAHRAPPHPAPGNRISLSIYSVVQGSHPTWFGEVYDYASGEREVFAIVADGSSSFRTGGQEVIALESYTSSEEVFAGMGSMTLHGIFVDRRKVVGGWYVDDGQVFYRESLFVVGGGAPVPSFISISFPQSGEALWTYSPVSWEASDGGSLYLMLLLLALAISVITLVAVKIR
ncbi:MAG: hypothetical protein QXM16_06800 [Nitrososphaerota archaeon]